MGIANRRTTSYPACKYCNLVHQTLAEAQSCCPHRRFAEIDKRFKAHEKEDLFTNVVLFTFVAVVIILLIVIMVKVY